MTAGRQRGCRSAIHHFQTGVGGPTHANWNASIRHSFHSLQRA